MVTITSLYICISYIYTYTYNFYYLSSLHSYCMSIFSVTCSMSLAYLVSILLLYSYFYTLHIPYSFYNLLFYFHELLSYNVFIYCFPIILFILLSLVCTVLVHILFVYRHILSYTIVYRHILCICVFTLTIELTFTTDSRGNLVLFVIQ